MAKDDLEEKIDFGRMCPCNCGMRIGRRRVPIFGHVKIDKETREAFYAAGQNFVNKKDFGKYLPPGFDPDDESDYIVQLRDPKDPYY